MIYNGIGIDYAHHDTIYNKGWSNTPPTSNPYIDYINGISNYLKSEENEMERRYICRGYNQKTTEARSEKVKITKVIFNDPATIVFWSDKTKTVVKAENEKFDPEKGLAMAIAKKALGNQGNYYNEFKKWIPIKVNKSFQDVIKETTDALKKLNNAITLDAKTSKLIYGDEE